MAISKSFAARRFSTGLWVGLTAVAVVSLLGGCADDDDATPAKTTTKTSTTTAPAPTEPSVTPAVDAVTAQDVIDAFRKAKLDAANPVDSTADMCDDTSQTKGLGCAQLVASDDVSVYQFATKADAADLAKALGDDSFRDGLIVLKYKPELTAADRDKYEAVLKTLNER